MKPFTSYLHVELELYAAVFVRNDSRGNARKEPLLLVHLLTRSHKCEMKPLKIYYYTVFSRNVLVAKLVREMDRVRISDFLLLYSKEIGVQQLRLNYL